MKGFTRPSWDTYFLQLARVVATRSNCLRRQVGAVLAKNSHVISIGYSGTPKGLPNCFEGGCSRCASDVGSGEAMGECLCVHAEQNAIIQAAYHGVSTKDSILYCSHSPCLLCAKVIINAGIIKIYYEELFKPYKELLDNINPFDILTKVGIQVICLKK